MPEESTDPKPLPEYVVRNRADWTAMNALYTAGDARGSWTKERMAWGVWQVPEDEIQVVPDVRGLDVIELGCGTAYWSAWLKKRGAHRVVGVDITPAQLATAAELNAEFGLGLELIEANAEDVPLPDASFDLAFSEYGASIWCDPYLWIAEAARLLRPAGKLLFMRNSTLSVLCSPDDDLVGERLVRPQKGMHHVDWPDDNTPSTDFHISASDLFRLLRDAGFELVDFRELFAPEDAVDHPVYKWTPAEWAKRWPAEEIWLAKKRS